MPDYIKNVTYKAYSAVRHFFIPHSSENISPNSAPNKVDIKVQMEPNFKTMNVSLATHQMSTTFSHVPLNKYVRSIFVVHPQYSTLQRVSEEVFAGQQYCKCVIEILIFHKLIGHDFFKIVLNNIQSV